MSAQGLQLARFYPSSDSLTSENSTSDGSAPDACRVPGCAIQNCRLITHRNHDPKWHRHARRLRHNRRPIRLDFQNRVGKGEELTIERDGVDGLPSLPIEEPLNLEFRQLFHHFFDSIYERMARTFRGMPSDMLEEYKQRMLEAALGSESYCMGLIVQAQTDVNIARSAVPETRQSLAVYTRAVQAFRRQVVAVQKLPQPFQVELALLSVCTLIVYDTFHERDSALKMHWLGLQQLVALRGGRAAVTISLPYVVHVDRMCAHRLRQPPVFVRTSPPEVSLPRPLFTWYGSKFQTFNQNRYPPIASRVISHCVDTCGLIGLWELSKGTRPASSTAGTSQQPPSVEYMYYSRDRVEEQYTIIHADVWNARGRDKFLLWTARLLEYPCTWGHFVPMMNKQICHDLIANLRAQDLRLWYEETDLLTWILFALTVVPTKYDNRAWVIQELKRVLTAKLKCPAWPKGWRETELENLRGFVWCDSLYTTKFQGVCDELERSNNAKLDTTDLLLGVYPSASLVEQFKREAQLAVKP